MTNEDLMDDTDVLFRGEKFISRSEAGVPDTFVPSASAILVGNIHLLWLVNPMALRETTRKPSCWAGKARNGLFRTCGVVDGSGYILTVCQFGKLWSVERARLGHKDEALTYDGTPICFTDFKEAMAIAKHCHPFPPKQVQCLRWIPIAGEVAPNSENKLVGEAVWRS